MEDIPNKIRNSMGIICDVQLEDKEGKKYISIKVNPYSVAVSLRGRYYYRTGSTKMELSGIELNEFLLKKAGCRKQKDCPLFKYWRNFNLQRDEN